MGNPKKEVLNKLMLLYKARRLICALVALALCGCTEVPEHCGDRFPALNPETQFCNQDNQPWDKCGGLTYNTNTQWCVTGNIKNKTSVFENVNEYTFEMIPVDGGTFTMGCTGEQSVCYSDERPSHSVTLSSYYIGKYEVTQGLWKAVMGSNNNPSYFTGGDNLPVETVTWNDVQGFITALNNKTGKRYRLPTEAEWEYAARGGQSGGTMYSGSNTIGYVAWYSGNNGSSGSSTFGTKPVGGKNPNGLGIYDMSGNVWEWVNDWYGSYNQDAQTNPQGPSTGSHRV